VLDEADFRFSDATSELVKILNSTVKGMPVLRTMQNRHRELNPRAFRVFGPKIIAMRGSYDDEGLESRFLSENMNGRHMRPEIPIHTPSAMREEALVLRNKLLHFRLCTLFDTEVNPSLVSPHLAPRFNQIALPLLSVVDDALLRTEIQDWLGRQTAHGVAVRKRELQQRIIGIFREAFADEAVASIPVRVVTERVSSHFPREQFTTKQVATTIRKQLHIAIHKSDGVHVVSRAELRAIDDAALRLGIQEQPTPEIYTRN
jgi:hypothetical protein